MHSRDYTSHPYHIASAQPPPKKTKTLTFTANESSHRVHRNTKTQAQKAHQTHRQHTLSSHKTPLTHSIAQQSCYFRIFVCQTATRHKQAVTRLRTALCRAAGKKSGASLVMPQTDITRRPCRPTPPHSKKRNSKGDRHYSRQNIKQRKRKKRQT